MIYVNATGALEKLRTPCLVTSLERAKILVKHLGAETAFNQAISDFKDAVGHTLKINLDGSIARLVLVGGVDHCSASDYKNAATVMAKAVVGTPVAQTVIDMAAADVAGKSIAWKAYTVMHALSQASYQFETYKSKPAKAHTLKRVRLHAAAEDQRAIKAQLKLGNALDQGLSLTKDLGNEPPNVCNPTYLFSQAKKLAAYDKVTVSALDEKQMTAKGMGAFMAVSQGSDSPGKMIVIQYKGGKKGTSPVALVGKGITFDTGGISLKPPPGMDEMKFDMCGAAAVLGATLSAIEAQLPINLLTIVAAAENMPSGCATRPGDIVTSSSGQTIEILNTDAEGRLVLCDAITHAKTFNPKAIVDVATLTGACIVALGTHASGLFSNDDDLAAALLDAGTETGDRAWRMPIWDEYQTSLKSNFADMANVGGRNAGSVTAACFLSRFAKDTPWAHLDVAGSAFNSGAAKGASGRPVPLLFQYLIDSAKA